jgi:hypothetical protein
MKTLECMQWYLSVPKSLTNYPDAFSSGGQLFIFSRKVCRGFRGDTHNWKKKPGAPLSSRPLSHLLFNPTLCPFPHVMDDEISLLLAHPSIVTRPSNALQQPCQLTPRPCRQQDRQGAP